MDSFYLLLFDSNRDDLEAVRHYELGGFDPTRLWKGKPLNQTIPSDCRLFLTEGMHSDYLGNPLSWMLISDRFAKVLSRYCSDQIEFIPITMHGPDGEKVKRYTLANPLGEIDAIKAKGDKTAVSIDQLTLKSANVPDGRGVFRLKYQPTNVVISHKTFEALRGNGLQGVAVKKLKVL